MVPSNPGQQEGALSFCLFLSVLLLAVPLGHSHSSHAQDAPPADTDSLRPLDRLARVYLDCDRCDEQYLRRNLTFVSYVRDRKQADIHLLTTSRSTGGGGRSYRMDFIGRGPFNGLRYELDYNAPPTFTDDERRQGFAEKVRLGLIPFVSHTPAGDRLSVSYDDTDTTSSSRTAEEDPWNRWVFEIGGSGDIGLEESEQEYEIEGNVGAERVTEAWKLEFEFESEYELDVFKRDTTEIRSSSRNTDFDADIVKSLGPHWGAGISGTAFSRSFINTDLAVRLTPAVEYNVFPYSMSDQRELTFTYRVGPEYRDYQEVTIFGKRNEFLVQQSLNVRLNLNRPWGSIFTSVEGAHFFHDLSKGRVEFFTGLKVQLVKGLSVFGRFNAEYIQDQLYLPAGETSLDEVLLRRQELATNFEIDASIGLSYTFGSIYNNAVNTRL